MPSQERVAYNPVGGSGIAVSQLNGWQTDDNRRLTTEMSLAASNNVYRYMDEISLSKKTGSREAQVSLKQTDSIYENEMPEQRLASLRQSHQLLSVASKAKNQLGGGPSDYHTSAARLQKEH